MPKVGFYGKIPARGDFVRAVLSSELVRCWDGWLQGVLPEAGSPPDWDAAPAWQLNLPAGLCSPNALGGVMLPSSDRIGRRFPLLLAAEGAFADDALVETFARIGRAAIGGLTPDTLRTHLSNIRAPTRPSPYGQAEGRWRNLRSAREMSLTSMPGKAAFVQMLQP